MKSCKNDSIFSNETKERFLNLLSTKLLREGISSITSKKKFSIEIDMVVEGYKCLLDKVLGISMYEGNSEYTLSFYSNTDIVSRYKYITKDNCPDNIYNWIFSCKPIPDNDRLVIGWKTIIEKELKKEWKRISGLEFTMIITTREDSDVISIEHPCYLVHDRYRVGIVFIAKYHPDIIFGEDIKYYVCNIELAYNDSDKNQICREESMVEERELLRGENIKDLLFRSVIESEMRLLELLPEQNLSTYNKLLNRI